MDLGRKRPRGRWLKLIDDGSCARLDAPRLCGDKYSCAPIILVRTIPVQGWHRVDDSSEERSMYHELAVARRRPPVASALLHGTPAAGEVAPCVAAGGEAGAAHGLEGCITNE